MERNGYYNTLKQSNKDSTKTWTSSSGLQEKSDFHAVLHPLDHQVGGHTQLMLLDQTTVCKPLIQRELLFYLNIPPELQPFVPSYKGVVQVRHVDGYPILYHPIRGSNQKSQLSQQPPHQPLQPQTSSPVLVSSINSTTSTATVTSNQSLEDSTPIVQTVGRFKVSTNKLSPFNNVVPRQSVSLSSSPATGSVVTGSGLSGPPKYTTCCSVDESIRKGSLNENGLYTLKNSQSQPELRVQISSCNDQRLLQKDVSLDCKETSCSTQTSSATSTSQSSNSHTTSSNTSKDQFYYSSRPSQKYFLLLENIASKYHLPCILDLKMGTRQHGDDATAEKRSRQMAKCAATTSASLGVRLCGMQVFREDLGVFVWKDKYFGRKLDKAGLKDTLAEFFHNGMTLRTFVIDSILGKLKDMKKAVEQQTSFRFYSTSLLIAYEGCSGRRRRSTGAILSSRQSSGGGQLPHRFNVSSIPGISLHDVDEDEDEGVHGTGSRRHPHHRSSSQQKPSRNNHRHHVAGSEDDDDSVSMDCEDSFFLNYHRSKRLSTSSTDTNDLRHHNSNSSGDDDSSLESSLELNQQSITGHSLTSTPRTQLPYHGSASSGCLPPSGALAGQRIRRPDRTVLYGCQSRSHHLEYHKKSEPEVDCRMIDFAHTILATSRNGSPVTTPMFSPLGDVYEGPDKGFLMGLNSLIRLLTEVREEGRRDGQDELDDSDFEGDRDVDNDDEEESEDHPEGDEEEDE